MRILCLLSGLLLVFTPSLLRAESGKAQIKSTSDVYKIEGTVTFNDTKEGLKISAQLTGVPPGAHGFHIHEFGCCDDLGKAAGGHYNPMGSKHGMVTKDGMNMAHAGDLGNIIAGADGKAELEAVLPGIRLTGGKYNVAGRSVILHEKEDDFSQPLGNAGGRIGCGIIAVTGK